MTTNWPKSNLDAESQAWRRKVEEALDAAVRDGAIVGANTKALAQASKSTRRAVANANLDLADQQEQLTQAARVPAAPNEPNATTDAYFDEYGYPRAKVFMTCEQVDTDIHGVALNISRYEMHGRPNVAGESWVLIAEAPRVEEDPQLEAQGLPAGDQWAFKIRAISDTGVAGEFSAELPLMLAKDETAPPKPAALTGTSRLGQVVLSWTGKTASGGAQPADFSHGEVLMSTTAGGAGTAIGRIGREDTLVGPEVPYNAARWYWVVAVDFAGNRSVASDRVSVTTAPLVDTDIIGRVLDGANMKLDSIQGDVIAAGAITEAKLAVDVTGKINDTIADVAAAQAAADQAALDAAAAGVAASEAVSDAADAATAATAAGIAAEAASTAAQDAINAALSADQTAELAWDAASVAVVQTAPQYALGSSETVAPTSGWSATSPARTPGSFIWQRTVITYGNSTTTTTSPVLVTGNTGQKGEDGTGIEIAGSVATYAGLPTNLGAGDAGKGYLVEADGLLYIWSGTNFPANGSGVAFKGDKGDQGVPGAPGADGTPRYTWLKYADTPTSGMSNSPTGKTYMGLAYNKTTPTESSVYADYQWSLIKGEQGVPGTPGADGTPRYTWVKYGTSASGAGMSDSPTGKTYIGLAYNKTTATESTVASDYQWALIKGSDGRGVSSTTITYQAGTSGTTAPTGTWQSAVPSVPAGQFLWTRTVITYTDTTTSTSYSVGRQGQNGSNGTPGAPGADGQTSYLHVAYASNATGTSNFSTSDPSGRTYMGTYTDFTEADSTNPALYAWSLIKGADGANGKGISSSVVTYQAGASGTTAPSGTWQSAVPTVTAGQFLWTRTVITFTDGASTTAYSVGRQGQNGVPGADGVSVSSVTVYYRTTTAGASAPAAPTTSTPPSPWSQTEPAYAPDTDLWAVTRVGYNNGTYSYTPVSKVSAFVAAGQAMAAAAGKGRNLYGTAQQIQVFTPYSVHDVWYDTANGNRMKSWSGTAWVDIMLGLDGLASEVGSAISSAQSAANNAASAAAGAQTAANNAATAAAGAQSTATGAAAAAADAQTAADDAAQAAAGAQAAADGALDTAETAMRSANGRNEIIYSGDAPSRDGSVTGDTWFQRTGTGEIVGQWEWGGTGVPHQSVSQTRDSFGQVVTNLSTNPRFEAEASSFTVWQNLLVQPDATNGSNWYSHGSWTDMTTTYVASTPTPGTTSVSRMQAATLNASGRKGFEVSGLTVGNTYTLGLWSWNDSVTTTLSVMDGGNSVPLAMGPTWGAGEAAFKTMQWTATQATVRVMARTNASATNITWEVGAGVATRAGYRGGFFSGDYSPEEGLTPSWAGTPNGSNSRLTGVAPAAYATYAAQGLLYKTENGARYVVVASAAWAMSISTPTPPTGKVYTLLFRLKPTWTGVISMRIGGGVEVDRPVVEGEWSTIRLTREAGSGNPVGIVARTAAAWEVGGGVEIEHTLFVEGAYDGPYFDGDSRGAWWGTTLPTWSPKKLNHAVIASVDAGTISVGTLSADRIAAKTITGPKLADGTVGTLQIADTAITNAKIGSAAITEAKIGDLAVTNAKIGALAVDTAKIANLAVSEGKIGSLAVTEAKIANLAVTNAKIGNLAVDGAKIANAAIVTAKIGDLAVTDAKIANLAVTTAKIQDAAITNAKIGNIDAGKITTGSLDAARIGARTISVGKLMVGDLTNHIDNAGFEDGTLDGWEGGTSKWEVLTSVNASVGRYIRRSGEGGASITNGARLPVKPGQRIRVDALTYHTGSISATLGVVWRDASGATVGTSTTGLPSGTWVSASHEATVPNGVFFASFRIGDNGIAGGVTHIAQPSLRIMGAGELIVDGSILTDKLAANAVTAAKIEAGAVTTVKLDALAVTAEKIAANAVVADKIQANAVTAVKIAANAVTADKIEANAVIAAKIAAGAVTTVKLDAGAVTADKVAANAITTVKLEANAVTAAKIAANTITANEIAANTITAGELAANSVTASEIAALSVAAGAIQANAITADKINAGAVTTVKLDALAVTAAKIAANAVTTDKLEANAITAKHTITGALIRTAASGARTEMTSSGLRVLNSSNQELVKLGYGITTGMEVRNPATNTLMPLAPSVFGTGGVSRSDQLSLTIPVSSNPVWSVFTRHSADTCVLTFTASASSYLIDFSEHWIINYSASSSVNALISAGIRVNGTAVTVAGARTTGTWADIRAFRSDSWARVQQTRGSAIVDTTPGATYEVMMDFSYYGVAASSGSATIYLQNRYISVVPMFQ